MTDRFGASSGSLSHATARTAKQARKAHNWRFFEQAGPGMMECIQKMSFVSNYNSPMNLAANASRRRPPAAKHAIDGYAMAALLVAMSVMAVLMSVAMPTWTQMIRREREEELIFRGNQYARAINQYQRKFANANPPSLDALIEQHFLRKKFKDPLSPNEDGEFQLLYVNKQGTGTGSAGGVLSTTPSGGIMGVASKNTGESIRILDGKNHYNEWQFIGLQQSTQAGGPPPGPGGRTTGPQQPQGGGGGSAVQPQRQGGGGGSQGQSR
jgi:type II secretory pathway pseudopilin PulG